MISQIPQLPTILNGVTDYYSQLNGIQSPRGVVIRPYASPEEEQHETQVGYYSSTQFIDPEKTVTNPDFRKIFGFADRIFQHYTDPDNEHDPFVDLAIHEWLHHMIDVLEVTHGISDLSDYVDKYHTQNFFQLAHHVGIAEPLIGDTSLNPLLNTIQKEKREIFGIT